MALSLNNNRAGEGLAYYQGLARTHPWWLIPIPFRQKAPTITGWPQLRLNPVDFRGRFECPSNAGVLLGVPCTNGLYLVDVDLDSPEAVQLADQYLPPTDCVFGRQSKPASHRFYYLRHPIPTKKYTDSNKKVIVELRGAGCQTVVPGSEHPSGERIEWVKNAEPAEIDPAELLRACGELAEACGWRPPASVVPVPPPQPVNGNLADRPVVVDAPDADWYSRCQKYLEKVPESISGQRGHDAMLRACCEAYRFGLDDSAARQLADWFNAERCTPPWNAREIEHKLSEAKKLVDAAGEFGVRREPEPHTLPPADAAPQTADALPVADWEPIPGDWEPMPLDCLPDVPQRWVEKTANALCCAPEYVAMPLLAVSGSACGSRWIEIKGSWSEPAVIWAAVIAPSGTQKSPAHKKSVGLLYSRQDTLAEAYKREKQQYDEDMQVYKDEGHARGKPPAAERMPKPTAPIHKRLFTSDTTVEALCAILADNPRGLLFERDELAGWMQGFDRYAARGGQDETSWLSMHQASRVTVDRKTNERFTSVPRAAVSVCGTIQPGTLARCLTPERFQSGFVARVLFVMPVSPQKCWTDDVVPPSVQHEMQVLIDRLLDLPMVERADNDGNVTLEPLHLPMDADARELWIEFYNSHAAEQRRLRDPRLAAAWSKLEAYAARFALIFTLLENPDAAVVGALSMHNAIRFTRWFCRETVRVYAMLDGKPDERADDAAILKWLAGRGGAATVREVRGAFWCYRASGAAEQAVERLIAAGHVVWDIPDSGPSGGRPKNRFRLAKP